MHSVHPTHTEGVGKAAALDSGEPSLPCSKSMWEVQRRVPRTTRGWLNHEEHRRLGISLHGCGWPPGSDRKEGEICLLVLVEQILDCNTVL